MLKINLYNITPSNHSEYFNFTSNLQSVQLFLGWVKQIITNTLASVQKTILKGSKVI